MTRVMTASENGKISWDDSKSTPPFLMDNIFSIEMAEYV